MSRYLDQDELPRRAVREEPEREISLSTGTVLALFFVLALICAVFFGFGFSMGKKSAQAASAELAASKSTAGSGHTIAEGDDTPSADTQPDTPDPAKPTPAVVVSTPAPAHKPSAIAASSPVEATPEPKTTVADKPAAKPAPVALRPTTPAPTPTAAPTQAPGTTIVQIAAISHAEDAAMLVTALKHKGYAVTSHTYPDKLVHIQVGPYANKKDAETMRQRLIADGYNAILK